MKRSTESFLTAHTWVAEGTEADSLAERSCGVGIAKGRDVSLAD